MDRDDILAISDGLTRILQDAPMDAVRKDPVNGAEAATLWQDLAENGFPLLAVAEEAGGLGGSIADIVPLAAIAGRFALPLPLIDTMLGNGLLSTAGLEPFAGAIGLIDNRSGTLMLEHADRVDAALQLDQGTLRLISLTSADVRPNARAEDGLSVIGLDAAESLSEARAPDWLTPESLQALGALMRAAAMSGAAQSILEITLEHTSTREQFGRPLSKFQAIQHHLSDIASEAAASAAAVGLAGDALAADPSCNLETLQDIAVAKSRCGQAAARVSAASHQAHGAIGFTREYKLGEFTRRLWQWQDAFGTETEWSGFLGTCLLQSNAPSLWREVSR